MQFSVSKQELKELAKILRAYLRRILQYTENTSIFRFMWHFAISVFPERKYPNRINDSARYSSAGISKYLLCDDLALRILFFPFQSNPLYLKIIVWSYVFDILLRIFLSLFLSSIKFSKKHFLRTEVIELEKLMPVLPTVTVGKVWPQFWPPPPPSLDKKKSFVI